MSTREKDVVRHLIVCDTHDSLLMFTRQGKVFSLKGYEVPEASRQARGLPVVNLIEMEIEDGVTAVQVISDFGRDSMLLATDQGEVKRTPLKQFESVRRAGLIAMKLKTGDSLRAARAASESNDAILISSDGQAMRFIVGALRVASRASGGVRGMRLRANAEVMGLVIDIDGDDLLVVTERGLGKRTPISEYPSKGRGGQGVQTFRINERTGPISIAANVVADEELILVSAEGIVMRTRADTISQQGRSTQGVQVMNIGDGDRVASLGRIDLGAGTGGDFDGGVEDGVEDDAEGDERPE